MTAKTMAEVLAEHRMSPQDYAYCICGTELSPKDDGGWTTHEVMEAHQAAALSAAGFGLVADAKAEALRDVAEALEMQPPKMRAQYVETLRLYASEPWRLTTCPSECAASHPGRENGAAS